MPAPILPLVGLAVKLLGKRGKTTVQQKCWRCVLCVLLAGAAFVGIHIFDPALARAFLTALITLGF
ncbi:MAG: hypothetical protein MPJ78_20440 [Hyphomicrobiaceae bacterium]|nr:hypothetical protein [Hyphomicrobiaceae bacterium]